jgi:DNA-binding transcriptional regulator YdaS (Cro superfamily)
MKKEHVIKHYGSEVETARALSLSPQAVNKWGTLVPLLSAYRIEALTRGKLRVNRGLYDDRGRPKITQPQSAAA